MIFRSQLFLLVPLVASALLASACEPPPKPTHPRDTSGDEAPPTPEWLFATESTKGPRGPKAECEKALTWILGERPCTGELCSHARDLGKEWRTKCHKLMADRVEEVNEVVEKVKDRVEQEPDACVREGTGLLRTQECGKPKECVEKAQRWISRCGHSYATPLIVLMLTRHLERRFQEATNVEFDTRSCKELGDAVARGVGCANEETCKQPAEAVAGWTDRCSETPATLPLAFAMADVLVGASKGVEPIRVDAEMERLEEGASPLATKDGKGTAVWVCGERPATLQAYAATRAKCSPGEVIFARLDNSRRVRTLSIPHASDAEFQRLFPFFELKGEREARDHAELEGFEKRVQEAVESVKNGQATTAAAQLARALVPLAGPVARNQEFRTALKDADAYLVPAVREWARAKVAAAARVRDPLEAALFAGRSLQHPLADVRLDGSVLPGSTAPVAGLAFAECMPASFALYRKEVSRLEPTLKRKVTEQKLEELRQRVRNEITACAAAEAAVAKAEEAAAACLFKGAECTPAQAVTLSSAADPEREKLSTAQRNLALMLRSSVLPPAEVNQFEAEKVSAGCVE